MEKAAALTPEEVLSSITEKVSESGPSEWEVYLVKHRSMVIAVKDGELDRLHNEETLAASIRFVKDGRLGFAHTSAFSDSVISQTIALALSGTRLADPDEALELPAPASGKPDELELCDDKLDHIPQETKFEKVKMMEEAAKKFDSRVEKVRQAQHQENESGLWIVNSRGINCYHRGTVVSANLMVKSNEGSDSEMGFEFDFSRFFDQLDYEEVGREAARQSVARLGGKKIPTQNAPLILENSVVADFLNVLASSFSADSVQKGKSVLAGRIGEKVMSDSINIIDNGLYPGGLASSPFDAEGILHQKTVLVGEGFLSGFLYDHLRARRDGVKSTGNAGRDDVKSTPEVSISNFYLEGGSQSPESLASTLNTGMVVTDVMGVHTANYITGDFSVGASGYWLENGKIKHPVKSVALAGNILTMFDHVLALGSDLRFFGSTGAPSIIVEGLSIGGS